MLCINYSVMRAPDERRLVRGDRHLLKNYNTAVITLSAPAPGVFLWEPREEVETSIWAGWEWEKKFQKGKAEAK